MTDPYARALAAVAAQSARDAFVRARVNNMPAQLRPYPHWGFYRANKSTISATDVRPFSNTNQASWATFERLQSAPIDVEAIGPTFVLDGSGVTVIDLDNPEKAYGRPEFAHLTVKEREDRIKRANIVCERIVEWAVEQGAWIERSSSGKAVHIFVLGSTPEPKYRINVFGHILTTGNVHMTGDLHSRSCASIPRADVALRALIGELVRNDIARPEIPDGSGTIMPPVRMGPNLTDEQCIGQLNPRMLDVLNGGTIPGVSWTRTTYRLILDLDKITGDPQQVERIVMRSPRLRNPGRDGRGQCRVQKVSKLFGIMLNKARAKNVGRPDLEYVDGVWQLRTGGAFDATSVKPRRGNAD